ncbi:MAG TPA: ATP-dependent DNA helicase UvrD2 [Nocardioidaceae bacterium]|nr:ATP-dependent DNA helicase UvrD2 [Nocardioidaceae bacterium]
MSVNVPEPEQLLAGLDPEQRAVATSLSGPLCVLAGAGTGKTRAITHRIAHGVHSGAFDPHRLLAVTFTTRAAGEMRTRLAGLGVPTVQARTFHSAALRQLRFFWPQVYGGELPVLVESKLGLLAEAARACRLPQRVERAGLKDLAAEVEWSKVSNVRPDDYAAVASRRGRALASFDAETVSRVFAAYEQVKRDRGRIDMEDVLLCTAAMLADEERVAATVRQQYRWFVVDEFQDVSPIQQALLDLWLGGREEICVVGDPAQTIYSFAGASADHLTGFRRRHPAAEVVRLVRNYRSTPQVLEVANGLLRSATSTAERAALQAQRAAGPAVDFVEHSDEVDEAESVAAAVLEARKAGVAPRDMAVLFRVNAQSEPFEEALSARSVPYVVRGGERFFERAEVRKAVTLLRGAARAATDADADGDPARGLVDEVTGVIAGLGWTVEPPAGGGTRRTQWESLDALRSVAADLAAASPRADLAGFVAEMDRRAAAQHAPAADGVTLASMHAAKGLEWSVVFVVGVHEGTVPIVYADTPSAVEEERRLLYVAVTRARDRLRVSWSRARTPGARSTRQASRFLDGLRPVAHSDGARAGSARNGRGRGCSAGRVSRCRVCDRPLAQAAERKVGRCSTCPSSYDEALFERLRGWRSAQAADEKVPAYCVCTDATLTAIAEVRPASAEALVTIPGIGKAKMDKYAQQLLAICASG